MAVEIVSVALALSVIALVVYIATRNRKQIVTKSWKAESSPHISEKPQLAEDTGSKKEREWGGKNLFLSWNPANEL
jgi:hypothetical protein